MKKAQKNLIIGTSFFIAAVLSLACATTNKIDYTKTYKTDAFSIPELNTVTTVSVGDSLLRQGTMLSTEAIKILRDTADGTVKKGIYIYDGKDSRSELYVPKYSTGATLLNTANNPIQFLVWGPHSEYENGNYVEKGSALQTGYFGTYNSIVKNKNVIPPEDYEFTTVDAPTEDSFQRILIYTGRENNIVHFSYREFNDNMARAAFTVDVCYDLNLSKTISYKNARIEIINATNNSITYKVLSNFN